MINKISISNSSENNKTSFKSVNTYALRSLGWMKNNPAIAACFVDMGSMVLPRTIVETKDRGKQSGIETFIREVSSLSIHAVMGLIGFGAASFISGKFNKEHSPVKAQNIFASGDTIQNMAEIWKNSNNNQRNFFDGFLKNLRGLNGSNWNSISNNSHDDILNNLIKLAQENEKSKDIKSLIIDKITQDTGARSSFRLLPTNNSKEISASISELIDNAVSLSNAFKTRTNEQFPKFVKDLMKNKTLSTILGLGVAFLLSISVQPINRMLTKKRTGNDGFVGVDTKKNDNSPEFTAMKTIAGIGFPIFAISTIDGKFKDLLSKIQFNSKIPSLNQFKFIYGFTISSRLFASRDGNELRESLIKDTLGFSTWLLFGDFVSKLVSRTLGGKELINNPLKNEGQNSVSYAKNWLMKTSVKSFEEILLPNSEKVQDKSKTLKTLYENAPQKLKSLVSKAAFAQVVGYLFSGVVLGWGIAKLNIFITQYLHSRQKAHNQMNNALNNNYQNDINHTFKEFIQT